MEFHRRALASPYSVITLSAHASFVEDVGADDRHLIGIRVSGRAAQELRVVCGGGIKWQRVRSGTVDAGINPANLVVPTPLIRRSPSSAAKTTAPKVVEVFLQEFTRWC